MSLEIAPRFVHLEKYLENKCAKRKINVPVEDREKINVPIEDREKLYLIPIQKKPYDFHKKEIILQEKIEKNISKTRPPKNITLLASLGMEPERQYDGSYAISEYRAADKKLLKALETTEEELLKGVTKVRGNVDLKGSELKSLGSIKTIKGSLLAGNSKLESFGSLEAIGGDCYIENSNIRSFDDLEYIGGDLYKAHTQLKGVPMWVRVCGCIHH